MIENREILGVITNDQLVIFKGKKVQIKQCFTQNLIKSISSYLTKNEVNC